MGNYYQLKYVGIKIQGFSNLPSPDEKWPSQKERLDVNERFVLKNVDLLIYCCFDILIALLIRWIIGLLVTFPGTLVGNLFGNLFWERWSGNPFRNIVPSSLVVIINISGTFFGTLFRNIVPSSELQYLIIYSVIINILITV